MFPTRPVSPREYSTNLRTAWCRVSDDASRCIQHSVIGSTTDSRERAIAIISSHASARVFHHVCFLSRSGCSLTCCAGGGGGTTVSTCYLLVVHSVRRQDCVTGTPGLRCAHAVRQRKKPFVLVLLVMLFLSVCLNPVFEVREYLLFLS